MSVVLFDGCARCDDHKNIITLEGLTTDVLIPCAAISGAPSGSILIHIEVGAKSKAIFSERKWLELSVRQ
jgi:hypothetical protein